MSGQQKNKNKQQNVVEEDPSKKTMYQDQFTIEKIQKRLKRLETENLNLIEEKSKLSEQLDSVCKDKNDMVEKLKKDLEVAEQEIDEKIKEIEDKEYLKEMQRQMHENELKSKDQFIDQMKGQHQQEVLDLKQKLQEECKFNADKAQLKEDRENLKRDLELERKNKEFEIMNKEREKVQATDKLKKNMLHRIQETKTSLLSLKREQLKTTTRLTVLQNHQLTTELEYQSKQTEKLLFKNAKLQEQVSILKRDVEIHKQVEQELAKRSHFSQKLNKTLSKKNQELEQSIEMLKSQQNQEVIINASQSKIKKDSSIAEEQSKSDIIKFLEKNIDSLEKKYAKLQNDYDICKSQNIYLEKKLSQKAQLNQNIALVLSEYLVNLRNNNQNEIDNSKLSETEEQNIKLTLINDLQTQQIHELSQMQKEQLIMYLLEKFQQVLTTKQISLVESLNQSQNTILEEQSSLIFPPIQNSSNQPNVGGKKNSLQSGGQAQNKFKDVPLEVSTKVVKSSNHWKFNGSSKIKKNY